MNCISFTTNDSPAFVMYCDWNFSQYIAYLRSWSASQRYLKATGIDAVGLVESEMQQAWGNPENVHINVG